MPAFNFFMILFSLLGLILALVFIICNLCIIWPLSPLEPAWFSDVTLMIFLFRFTGVSVSISLNHWDYQEVLFYSFLHISLAHGFSFFLQMVYFLLIILSKFFLYEFYRWIANTCNLHIRPTHFYYASFSFFFCSKKDSCPIQQDNYSTIFPATQVGKFKVVSFQPQDQR